MKAGGRAMAIRGETNRDAPPSAARADKLRAFRIPIPVLCSVFPLSLSRPATGAGDGASNHAMKGKVCIVTGANTGIGKETARGLAHRGATVVLACRDVTRGEEARASVAETSGRDDVALLELDLGDQASIRAFAAAFRARYGRLDVLVNNAGVAPRKRATTKDGFESTFGVNHLGTALLTLELLDLLRQSAPSRVVVVSSDLHYRGKMAWDDLQFQVRDFNGLAAYNQSKLANVLFTKALARRLAGSGVTVDALHPGVVATDLTRSYPRALVALWQMFLLTPAQGATCSLYVATSPELDGVTGEYFEKSRVKPASRAARDEVAQEKLWALTEQLLGRGEALAVAV
jgi:NAD(P)-dependent dehydrogenase (short-subunit alcohol dehydrogenase family)